MASVVARAFAALSMLFLAIRAPSLLIHLLVLLPVRLTEQALSDDSACITGCVLLRSTSHMATAFGRAKIM